MKRRLVRLDRARRPAREDPLRQALAASVIGQPQALQAVLSCHEQCQAGLTPPGRPIGTLLFLGPTGTGKTLLAERTAAVFSGKPDALVSIDCGEFQNHQEIAKLIGAPPGYLGHKETKPILTQAALDASLSNTCPYSFLLFDEIEKGCDALRNLLLGILSKARMRTGPGETVNFDRCLIFLTSNLGVENLEKYLQPIGLTPPPSIAHRLAGLGAAGLAAVKKTFSPEFFNRLDYTVVFQPLTREHLLEVLDLELAATQSHVFHSLGERGYLFAVSPAARSELLDRGTNPRYGARHLRRTLREHLIAPLSEMVHSGQIAAGDMALLDWKDAGFHLSRRLHGLTPLEMTYAQQLIYVQGIEVPGQRHFLRRASAATG